MEAIVVFIVLCRDGHGDVAIAIDIHRGAFGVARFDKLGQCESLYIVKRATGRLHVFCIYCN